MAIKYFAQANQANEERLELVGVTRLAEYIRDYPSDHGQLSVNNYEGLKLDWNRQTGEVNPVSTEQRVWITYVFSNPAFQTITMPVREAISLIAKLEMLLELAKCDPAIGAIIKHRHIDNVGRAKNLNTLEVERTLDQIVKLVSPRMYRPLFGILNINQPPQTAKHLAIYNILKHVDFDAIKSQNDALEVIRHLCQEQPPVDQAMPKIR